MIFIQTFFIYYCVEGGLKMKEEFLKKTNKKIGDGNLKDVSGGNKKRKFGKIEKFTEKETQEEWIDLMGIPKKK